MNWYFYGVISSSYRIGTRSHRVRMVVKFYNHTLSASVPIHSDAVLCFSVALLMKTVIENSR